MKRKLVLGLLIAASASLFYGCDMNSTIEDTKDKIEDTTDKASDSMKDAKDSMLNKYDEEMMNLNKEGFIKKVEAKGFKVSDDVNKDYSNEKMYNFSVNEDLISINGNPVSLYMYDSKESLDEDVNKIQANEYFVDGAKLNTTNPPHIYRSGKLMVIYSGTNTEINDLLLDIFKSKVK